jgi:para-aminobenzoate synthetase/4-amino-4-deoxychorismate lyase
LERLSADVLEPAGTVFIEDGPRAWLFREPRRALRVERAADLDAALADVDAEIAAGSAVAGYLSYDAGVAWAGRRPLRHAPAVPLAWLGVYDRFEAFGSLRLAGPEPGPVVDRALNLDEGEYVRRVERIREAIGAGEVYQANFACKMRARTESPAWALFARLREAHPVGHAAFVGAGDHQVLSLSPELFLRKTGDRLLTRPMKGTIRRGRWLEEDHAQAELLRSCPKSRAENLMIVDLMRNDLGRVCGVGSVEVPALFQVERYPSVLQMTSDVTGRLAPGVGLGALLRAAFPPGSVTGAPKSRAVDLIGELELEGRGVYCGAVGAFFPDGDLTLNVAIRTLVQRGSALELGVGSGIVWDSDPREEWREVLLKSRFLDWAAPAVRLFETMRREADGRIELLEMHLDRMARSAAYLGFAFDRERARRATAGQGPARVRLALDRYGALEVEEGPLPEATGRPWRVLVAARRVDSRDPRLAHKTTDRDRYDAEIDEARRMGFDEALHVNERGELTEGCLTNLLVCLDGEWWTPPEGSGLLPGVYRRALIEAGRVRERTLWLSDLRRASAIRLCNAPRGEIEAVVEASAGL